MLRSALILLLTTGPVSAAAQNPLAVLQAADARVTAINWQLATRNVDLCQKRVRASGIRLHAAGLYAPSMRDVAKRHFGIDEQPAMMVVVPGSAAARTGAAVGDVLTGINGAKVPQIPNGRAGADTIAGLEQKLDVPEGAVSLSMDTLRAGKRMILEVTGDLACASRIELLPSSKLNARADGETVRVTTGVLIETRDDSELAFVIAHEMAHNVLDHPATLTSKGRTTARIRETEIEADRFAIRLMRGAGYDPFAAARFWARFGKKTGFGIFSDGTHLRTKARVALLEREAAGAAQ